MAWVLSRTSDGSTHIIRMINQLECACNLGTCAPMRCTTRDVLAAQQCAAATHSDCLGGRNAVTGLGLDGVVLSCSAPIHSLDLAWLKLLHAAWHKSNHWTGLGFGCCTLPGPNPVTGLGLAVALVRCSAPIQSLDRAWIGLFCAAWRQSNHWTGPGWGCSALFGANPVT